LSHRVQVLTCHEVIGERDRATRLDQRQWCNLKPFAWCYDHDHYVCDIHAFTRHEGHNLGIEFPENRARAVQQEKEGA